MLASFWLQFTNVFMSVGKDQWNKTQQSPFKLLSGCHQLHRGRCCSSFLLLYIYLVIKMWFFCSFFFFLSCFFNSFCYSTPLPSSSSPPSSSSSFSTSLKSSLFSHCFCLYLHLDVNHLTTVVSSGNFRSFQHLVVVVTGRYGYQERSSLHGL